MAMHRPAILVLLAVVLAACTLMPPRSEHGRARQFEDSVQTMAATAVESGQLETAHRLYKRLLEIDPESVGARMGLGDVALRQQDTVTAARWYLAALMRAQVPEQRHTALLAHGRAALAAGQLKAARESFTRLTDPDENAPRASVAWGHNGIGLTLMLDGDPIGAVTAMERAMLLAPEETRFRRNLDRALGMSESVPWIEESFGDDIAVVPPTLPRNGVSQLEQLSSGVEPKVTTETAVPGALPPAEGNLLPVEELEQASRSAIVDQAAGADAESTEEAPGDAMELGSKELETGVPSNEEGGGPADVPPTETGDSFVSDSDTGDAPVSFDREPTADSEVTGASSAHGMGESELLAEGAQPPAVNWDPTPIERGREMIPESGPLADGLPVEHGNELPESGESGVNAAELTIEDNVDPVSLIELESDETEEREAGAQAEAADRSADPVRDVPEDTNMGVSELETSTIATSRPRSTAAMIVTEEG